MSARAKPQEKSGRGWIAERRVLLRRETGGGRIAGWLPLQSAAGLVESVVVHKGKTGGPQQANVAMQSGATTPNCAQDILVVAWLQEPEEAARCRRAAQVRSDGQRVVTRLAARLASRIRYRRQMGSLL